MTFDNLYIERPRYQKLLESYKGTPSVKVLQGVRRCGKSTLLDIYRKSLLDGGVEDRNVFCRKLDSLAVGLDVTAETLLDDFTRFYALADSNLPVYVFLDEIQEVDGWEKVVRKLRAQPGVDVYVTGSNADVLSRELATLLAGRCTTLDVHPLSFAEYLEFWKARRGALDSVDEAFAYYLRYGGMPGLFYVPEGEEFWRRELRGIYESVLLKDVALRCAVRDMVALDRLARYVLMMGGNLFSTRKVASALAASGLKVSPSTVDGYLDALAKAYLVYPCMQEGLAGKKVLAPQRKFYAVDSGLTGLARDFRARDTGYALEGAVHMELVRRGYSVAVGTLLAGEVDFVARRHDETVYVQVSQTILAEETYAREVEPLEAIRDSFPKVIITLDRVGLGTTKTGIKIVNAVDWMRAG
ncbi:ATP-binding protein [Collinsella sp. TF05-9AC]|uniref:ATP-binding protein n=1 Tax=Collinsella sp. TF05-9AC TaxID=2292330 RepID=UPI000E44B022|nr:ATP-binding protein [Collinsella sp. TF05-9AC]RGL72721.1 ATP-binding protein [Collinsella sp. TF05-9AC]